MIQSLVSSPHSNNNLNEIQILEPKVRYERNRTKQVSTSAHYLDESMAKVKKVLSKKDVT